MKVEIRWAEDGEMPGTHIGDHFFPALVCLRCMSDSEHSKQPECPHHLWRLVLDDLAASGNCQTCATMTQQLARLQEVVSQPCIPTEEDLIYEEARHLAEERHQIPAYLVDEEIWEELVAEATDVVRSRHAQQHPSEDLHA